MIKTLALLVAAVLAYGSVLPARFAEDHGRWRR
jgi:hypothetical protein